MIAGEKTAFAETGMPEKITKRLVDATRPGERDVFVWDSEVKGFGLKVTPSGGKIYILQYRLTGTSSTAPRRFTIGKHGSPWTAEKARDEAIKRLGQIKGGIDPQARKSTERQAAASAPTTVAKAVELFIERHAKPNTRSWPQTKRTLDKHVVPVWGKRPVESITRKDVNQLLDDLVDAGTPVLANRTLAITRKLFNWAVSKDIVPANPCQGVHMPSTEEARDRVLSDAEVREVLAAACAIDAPFGSFVTMLLLTAQRRTEVAGMRWSELDLGARVWILPKERSKNGKAHAVPLSGPAVRILQTMPRIVLENGQPSDFVFTTTGTAPLSDFSGIKNKLDRQILEARRKTAVAANENPEAANELPDWRFHDIRRTVTTGLAQLGVAPHVADRILNHVQGTIRGVAAVYNRHSYLDERRQALDLWAKKLLAITAQGTFSRSSGSDDEPSKYSARRSNYDRAAGAKNSSRKKFTIRTEHMTKSL